MKLTPSISGVAFKVSEIIADHAPRFVAIVANGDAPKYGHGKTSFAAIVDAIGFDAANALIAEMKADGSNYRYDENFRHDAWRAYDDGGELLAILIRA